MAGLMRACVHDLVRIGPATRARLELPAWAEASLARASWVVVRRACERDGLAVGVRGATRGERCATAIADSDILARQRPEDLVSAVYSSAGALADAARQLDGAARACGLVWGPTGSYAFELASGTKATHAASDLDCIVRTTGATPAALLAFARSCGEIARTQHTRIDAELAFAGFGVALADFVTGGRRIVAKTPGGPAFVDRASLAWRA